jgi:hypothetical protein
MRLRWLLVCAVAGASTTLAATTEKSPGRNDEPLKYEEPRHLTGAIYGQDRGQQKLLFRFRREATRAGDRLNVQRDFSYPEDQLAAQERVMYEGDWLVSYELKELQIGASGTVRVRRNANDPAKATIEFSYSAGSGRAPKVRTESLTEDALIADMVGPFLASHWEALRRGEKVKCRYIVLQRRETVGFTFVKDPERASGDGRVMRVRMEASSRFVAALVDPLFFSIEEAPPHRVLQYAGRTTPKIQAGGKWKDLDARTVFDWSSAR